RRLRREHGHLAAAQPARIAGDAVDLDVAVAVQQDEFIPRVRMALENSGESAHCAGRDRCGNFHGACLWRGRHQNRAAAEIVSVRTTAEGENGVCTESGERELSEG